MSELRSSEEICEALCRHVETSGSEVFEKNFIKNGKVVCSVWCVVGENAEPLRQAVSDWLKTHNFALVGARVPYE